MALDALPVNRPVRCTAGSLAVVDLYLRNQVNAAFLRAALDTWDFRVYDEQGISPDAPIYEDLVRGKTETNADSSDIILTAVAQDGANRLPVGRTFLHKFDPVILFGAEPGRLYRIEYTFRLITSEIPFVVGVALSVDPAYQ